MSIASVDRNLSLTFHFGATSKNIQLNAKLWHSICASAGGENENKLRVGTALCHFRCLGVQVILEKNN